MTEQLDPKDVRILSDILALVLDEQPGQAIAALETIRSRAKRHNMTGGALKNLFMSLAVDENHMGQAALLERIQRERDQLEKLVQKSEIRVRILQSQLSQSQQDSQYLLSEAALGRSQQSWRYAAIGVALFAGLLIGTAATSVVHTMTTPVRSDRASYLR